MTGTEALFGLLSVVVAWGALRLTLVGASFSMSLLRLALSRSA